MTHVMLENLTGRQRPAYILRIGKRRRLERIAVELGMSRENGVAPNGAPCCAGSPECRATKVAPDVALWGAGLVLERIMRMATFTSDPAPPGS